MINRKCKLPTSTIAMVVAYAATAVYASPTTQLEIGPAGITDATLSAWNDTANYGSHPSYELRNDQVNASSWAVVRFDLPALAPGEFITDATMTFDYFANFNATQGTMTVDLNRPLYSWDEAGVSWRNRTAAWLWGGASGQENIDAYHPGTTNPVNYATRSLGQVTLTVGEFGLKTFQSGALTSVLNGMSREVLPNHGFLLNPGRSGGIGNRFYMASSERTDQVLPSLTLNIASHKQYPFGWFDSAHNASAPSKIAGEGGNVIIPYRVDSWEQTTQYLDAAAAAGVGVILQLADYYIMNHDVVKIREHVNAFDDHPAVRGWYLADEPTSHCNVVPQGKCITVTMAETAYGAVRLESTKPVFIAFSELEFKNGLVAAYAHSYDTFLFNEYPLLAASAEHEGLDDWRGLVESARAQAIQHGKTWWSVAQGIGKQPDGSFDKRLPTLNETRYMAYLSVLNEADGLIYWAHYWAEDSVALLSAPYTGDGESWLGDVWRRVATEFAEHGNALSAGAIAGAVSDNRSDVVTSVFQDPQTGEFYLIALNVTAGGEYPTFTLNLPGRRVVRAVYLGEPGMDIDVANDQFADTFPAYAPHVYRLVTEF